MSDPVEELRAISEKDDNKALKTISLVLSVVEVIPEVGSVASGINKAIDFCRRKREESLAQKRELMAKEIINGQRFITRKGISDIEIVENFGRMIQLIDHTNINEKIEFAVRVFIKGCLSDRFVSTDIYEEYLQIIRDLSLREIKLISILRDIEEHPQAYENDDKTKGETYEPVKYWKAFKKRAADELTIPEGYVYPMLKRIERTGLFAFFNGMSFAPVEEGETTEYFRGFYWYIEKFEADV